MRLLSASCTADATLLGGPDNARVAIEAVTRGTVHSPGTPAGTRLQDTA